MSKHIIDNIGWQEACDGVECDYCPFYYVEKELHAQDMTFCRIREYIEKQQTLESFESELKYNIIKKLVYAIFDMPVKEKKKNDK